MFARLLCTLLLTTGLASAGTKNLVYKGTFTSKDLSTGNKIVVQTYLVFGEETPVDAPSTDRYAYINSSLIYFAATGLGEEFPKKRYVRATLGKFRTLEKFVQVKGEERTREYFLQGTANPTDSGNGFADLTGFVLHGLHPKGLGALYDAPDALKGSGLSFSSGLSPSEEKVFGGAASTTFSFKLVTALTDPIPGGESLADTVKRVTDDLESRGFIELVP